MAIRTRHVSVGGRQIRVLEAGSGRPLVLVHAFPLTAELFRPQLEAPPPGWRLVAPDMLEPPERSMDDYAARVEAVVDALGLAGSPLVVGGVSMGGYIMFSLLRRATLSIRALIFADTRAEADTEEGRAARQKMIALVDEAGAEGVAREMVPKLLGESTRRERPEAAAVVRELITRNSPAAIRAAVAAMMARQDSTPLLPSIAVPALVVVGEEDVLTPPPNAETLARGIRGSRLVRIAGAGHLASFERPAAFTAELGRFLDGV
jgi:pimeloyl-ACP methyl ester carboxylesterase